MAQPQRLRRRHRGRRLGLAAPGQDVDDDISGMDALTQRFLARRLDRGQTVAQHRAEDGDHLPIAISHVGKLAAHSLQPDGSSQSLNGAPFRSAPGLRAKTGT